MDFDTRDFVYLIFGVWLGWFFSALGWFFSAFQYCIK